jgi:hypothetical protein
MPLRVTHADRRAAPTTPTSALHPKASQVECTIVLSRWLMSADTDADRSRMVPCQARFTHTRTRWHAVVVRACV